MKFAILGATGRTGTLIVEQALAEGHEVVVLVRDPTRLTARHERLTVVSGQLSDPETVERVVAGAEAVISVLGPRARTQGKPITQGIQNVLASMKKHSVRRIIVSSTPSAVDPNDVPDLRFKIAIDIIRLIARSAYEDIVAAASAVRESDRDWTIVRVSMLSDAPKTGVVKVGYANKEIGMRITRADLAEFMLKQAQDRKYVGQAPVISNGRESRSS